MNLKAAHLVSIQFGIFIGIVLALVFSRFEFSKSRTATERQEPVTERVAAVEPQSEPEEELADVIDDRGEPELADALTAEADSAMPTEYSPEAVERSMAILTKLYYEQISPRRTASTIAANSPNGEVAPSYTEVAEEPAVAQYEEPPPEPVAYVQPTQVIVYPQPAQFVVFSRPRRFVNRCQPTQHPNVFASNSHRRRGGGGTHVNGVPEFENPASPSAALRRRPRSFGLDQRRTTAVPTCSSTQGFTARGQR